MDAISFDESRVAIIKNAQLFINLLSEVAFCASEAKFPVLNYVLNGEHDDTYNLKEKTPDQIRKYEKSLLLLECRYQGLVCSVVSVYHVHLKEICTPICTYERTQEA